MPGLNVMLAHDYYPEGHQGGVGVYPERAARGDQRRHPADRTPGQWQPCRKSPSAYRSRDGRDLPAREQFGRIGRTARDSIPSSIRTSASYNVRVRPEGAAFRIIVDLDAPLPDEWAPRRVQHGAFPGVLFGKTLPPRHRRACSRGSRTGRARSTGAASSPSRWPPAAASWWRPSRTGSGWSSRTTGGGLELVDTAGSTPTAGSWSAHGSPAARRRAPWTGW
jgi:hypothetical protein